MTPKTIALREKHGILILNLRTAFDEGYTAGIAEERERSQKLVDAFKRIGKQSATNVQALHMQDIAWMALTAYESESVEKTEGE